MTKLGDRVRELRVTQGVSQRALAKAVDVGFPHISKIEAGHEPASTELITKIAQELGVDPEELLMLAERLPDDLTQTVLDKRELAPQFLRSWREGSISDAEVRQLIDRGSKTQ